ncbi:MAG: hypothetical protein ABI180_11285 [Microcoleus sp.]
MPYNQFNLEQIKSEFGITLCVKFGLFAEITETSYSHFLSQTLDYNIPLALAINSEKSRSEMIVALILIELRKQFDNGIERSDGGFNRFLSNDVRMVCGLKKTTFFNPLPSGASLYRRGRFKPPSPLQTF